MNVDIREHIINNFKNSNKNEINDSINESINSKDEIVLPGLGVFFELLWENSSTQEQQDIINKLSKCF